jgi:hypothetical protein
MLDEEVSVITALRIGREHRKIPGCMAVERFSFISFVRWLQYPLPTLVHLLLVDPIVLGRLPALDLSLVEPKSNLLLGGLDGVRAVANVATDILINALAYFLS